MRLRPGDRAIPIVLPSIDGGELDLRAFRNRRYMLSFLRFASCPFCNLRLHELVTRFSDLSPRFSIVAVFDSPLDNLQMHAAKHKAPFPILADEKNVAHRAYGIERSIAGVFKGMIGRMPTLLSGMFLHGYLPLVIKGSTTTMPADFLVNEKGVIKVAHYGHDEGDHLPFDTVPNFSYGTSITRQMIDCRFRPRAQTNLRLEHGDQHTRLTSPWGGYIIMAATWA